MKLKSWKTNPKTRTDAVIRAIYLMEILSDAFMGKFKIKINENSGWHYAVQCGTLDINYSVGSNMYWVMVSTDKACLGQGKYPFHVTNTFKSKNPILAVKKAMDYQKQIMEKLTAVYEDNKKQFSKRK